MAARALTFARRACQLATAAVFIGLPYANTKGFTFVSGNFLSFHAGPLSLADPLAALQTALLSHTATTRLLLGAGLAIVLAVGLGAVFCSYLCPFGLLSELAHKLGGRLRPGRPRKLQSKNAFKNKLVWSACALAVIVIFGLPPLLNQLSLPAWYARIFQIWFGQGDIAWMAVGIAVLLAAEAALGKRLWCSYLCPQSLIPLIAQRLSPFGPRVRFNPSACTCTKRQEACIKACTLDLNPRTASRTFELACSNCGDCVVACNDRGRALTFGKPE